MIPCRPGRQGTCQQPDRVGQQRKMIKVIRHGHSLAPRVPARVAAFVRRGCGINGNQGLAYAYSGVRRSRSYSPGGGRRILRPAARIMSCSGPWSTLISPLAAGFSFRSQVPARTASGAASLACAYVRRESGALSSGRSALQAAACGSSQLVKNSSSAFGLTARCQCSVIFPFLRW